MAASPSNSASLSGVLERIIFLNEENAYTIAEFRPESPREKKSGAAARVDKITIVGPLPGVQCGETLHLTGEWTRHTQHGDQFRAAPFREELPARAFTASANTSAAASFPASAGFSRIKSSMCSAPGTFRITERVGAAARAFRGIGQQRAPAIKHAWEGQRAAARTAHFPPNLRGDAPRNACVWSRPGPQAEARFLHRRALSRRPRNRRDRLQDRRPSRHQSRLRQRCPAPPRRRAALRARNPAGGGPYRPAPGGTHRLHRRTCCRPPAQSLLAARLDALVEPRQLVRHDPASPTGNGDEIGERESKVQDPKTEPAALSLSTLADPQPTSSSQPAARDAACSNTSHRPRGAENRRGCRTGWPTSAAASPPIRTDSADRVGAAKGGPSPSHALQLDGCASRRWRHKFSILTGGPGTARPRSSARWSHILKAKKVRVRISPPPPAGRPSGWRRRPAASLPPSTACSSTTPPRGGFAANEDAPLATDFLIVDEVSMLDTPASPRRCLQAVPSPPPTCCSWATPTSSPAVGAGNMLKDLDPVRGR